MLGRPEVGCGVRGQRRIEAAGRAGLLCMIVAVTASVQGSLGRGTGLERDSSGGGR